MVDFRVVVSDSKSGQAYQITASGPAANKFIGKGIGDTVGGDAVGLAGYSLKLTGGTDKDGFPMRADLPGPGRKKILQRLKYTGRNRSRSKTIRQYGKNCKG